jgi:hypothetical protein
MASGVGANNWGLASPDYPMGAADEGALGGNPEESPYVTGPAVDGFPDSSASGTGAVHVNTGANPGGATRASNWSNLFDWRNGPMFWMMLATIAYFGLVSIHVQTRLGR